MDIWSMAFLSRDIHYARRNQQEKIETQTGVSEFNDI